MRDPIERQDVFDLLNSVSPYIGSWLIQYIDDAISSIPSAQLDFDITVKINKAYDDGYEAGYLQGRHDWGDLNE